MLETNAWVLHRGPRRLGEHPEPGELVNETFFIPDIGDEEVLAEPIYGCWEGNMTHALQRDPIDVCRFRREPKVVLGNAGVVRVLTRGSAVTDIAEGDLCLVFGNAVPDAAGYMVKALAYDAPRTMGVLAKRTKLHRRSLIRIPAGSRHSLARWAAFSLRYVTAWSNWRLAFGCYRLQMRAADCPAPFVVAWGGGVSLGQLLLAKHAGCKAAMITSQEQRLASLRDMGIVPIDRRRFPDLCFDPQRYRVDGEYTRQYNESEKAFLGLVAEAGNGQEVAIFLDHIGAPVFPATLAALGRQGVVASAGWKRGAQLTSSSRAVDCIQRHQYVNTHYARKDEALEAVAFAEQHDWLPPVDQEPVHAWDQIPALARDYAQGRIRSYFPLFQVNPE